MFLSPLRTGKALDRGHPRCPKAPLPSAAVPSSRGGSLPLTKGHLPGSGYHIMLSMLSHSQHSHFIFEEMEAQDSLSQTMGTRPEVRSHGGQRPNSSSYSFFILWAVNEGRPWVRNHVVPSPLLPGGSRGAGLRMKPGGSEIMFSDGGSG